MCPTLVLLLISIAVLLVSAELPDEHEVTAIQQKTACPTIYCPWNCDRFMDENGCLFCGRCNPKTSCPPIKCPNLPYFVCVAQVGRDGCTTCKCKAKPRNVCGPSPMCSADCSIIRDVNGCERCSCPPRLPSYCPEPANAPCRRADCWRERGADGCYSCICPDDVYSCPEIKCDPNLKCVHTVDTNTGCATGCQCEVDNNTNVVPNQLINNRLPAPVNRMNRLQRFSVAKNLSRG